jgi:DNA-binding CsgD family transcriptional regulator
MSWVLVIWAAINFILFGVLLGYAWRVQRRSRETPIAFVATALVLVAGAFLVSSIQRIGIQVARTELLDASWEEFFLRDFQLLLSLVAMAAALYALTRVRSAVASLEDRERMLSVLTDKASSEIDVSTWSLTSRESHVLETIVAGQTSDQEIADALFISTATAATHVRNILKKTGLSSRMDLMLVGGRGSADGVRRTSETGEA